MRLINKVVDFVNYKFRNEAVFVLEVNKVSRKIINLLEKQNR